MKVTVLIENQCCKSKKYLKSEHGLSLHINHNGKLILLDTGSSGAFMENAVKMGINIEDVEFVVLSHSHIDHAGGLIKFLETNEKAKVYMSNNSKEEYYIKMLFLNLSITIPKEVFTKYMDRICFVNDFSEIEDNIYLVPNAYGHAFPLGEGSKKLLVKKGGKLQQDNFNHELTLVINNNSKLDIFTGCSHNGISNMVEHAISFFPGCSINYVVGGFHLMGIPFKSLLGESEHYIEELGNRMMQHNIEKVYTAHCTGSKAYKLLKKIMGNKIVYINTGSQLVW